MSSENKIHWKLSTKRHDISKKKPILEPVSSHPLLTTGEAFLNKYLPHLTTKDTSSDATKLAFIDPLSSVLEGSDPLTSHAGHNLGSAVSSAATGKTINTSGQTKFSKHTFEDMSPVDGIATVSWEDHCLELSKFVTKQHLTLASSFLSTTDTGVIKVQNNIPDRTKGTRAERVKARLEQLDSLSEGGSPSGGVGALREMGGLTQEQFSHHLLFLKAEMKQAWEEEQRVKALKITIQCVKALALSPPEIFYPCKFSIIAELLDTLGQLVRVRLNQLTAQSAVHSPQNCEAEETARNWFYKVASIRELLPRIYLEAAILPSCAKLPAKESDETLKRLMLMCRGIGDPLVASYLRTYIVHIGQKHRKHEVDYIYVAVEDFITSCRWGWNGNGIDEVEVMGEDFESGNIIAQRIFYPPFMWLLQCLPKTHDSLQRLLLLTEESNGVMQYVSLQSILNTFPPVLLAPQCLVLLHLLDYCFSYGEKPEDLLIDLASVVCKVSPSEEQKMDVLNGAWVLVTRMTSLHSYLKAANAWLKFTGMNYTCSEMDKILSDVLKRLSRLSSIDPATSYEPLLSLLTTAITSNPRSEEMYTFSSFRGLLSIFQRESGTVVGMGYCHVKDVRDLLDAALHHHQGHLKEPSVIQLLLSLFSSLHDGINALTTQDEQRQIAQLVNNFIRKVNFGKDFELQLEFYVNARASFSNLDSVIESLIQHVLRLQVSTLQMVKGRHTSKTAAFERACTAYCFITVPSLSCPSMKLRLYLLCGAVAMINNCMGQGDACIKSAIRTVLEVTSELNSAPSASNLLDGVPSAVAATAAYLVAIPDPPDVTRPLYLFRGLVNCLQSLRETVEPISFCKLNLAVLKGLCASAQDVLPYHFCNVDGNDKLYGGDLSIKMEAEVCCSDILTTVLTLLKEESVGHFESGQIDVICELLSTISKYGDLSDKKMKNLTLSLLNLVKKHTPSSKFNITFKELFEERLKEAV